MIDLTGKRLLILGGSRISIEIIKKAREKRIFTVVTDWYDHDKSPAKKVADKSYQVSTTDMDGLLDIIKKENIDGILTGFTDSVLPHYAKLCELAGLPCYGTEELFELFIDKKKYKEKLREFDIPVVEEYNYTLDQIIKNENIDLKYPLFVKPSDGSGSRGVSICRNREQLIEGYKNAQSFSENEDVLIERYIEGKEATLFFLFDQGKAYLSGLGNRHVRNSQGRDILALPVAYTFPSVLIPDYMENIMPKMKSMFENVQIENGMMFAQCLIEDDECIVYDIGYRLTGSLEYYLQESISGYNPLEMMIDFALTGDMFANTSRDVEITPYWNSYGYNISFLMKTGLTIETIEGINTILEYPDVIEAVLAHPEGDSLDESEKGMLKQIMLRVFGKADSIENMKKSLDDIYRLLTVKDVDGTNVLLPGLEIVEVDGNILEECD